MDGTMRIGVVGTREDFEQIVGVFADDAEVVRLHFAAVRAAVRGGAVDVLVVGPAGHRSPGLARVAEALRDEPNRAQVAILALVAHGDSAALAEAFDNEVADCAAYPIDLHEIGVRIRALQRRRASDARLRADVAEAHRLVRTDPVTGLASRRHLDDELAASLQMARTEGVPLTVLMIDIDGFKAINDLCGHVVGDQVLHAISMRLAENIRTIDTLARYGGDELVVVMPGVDAEAGRRVAERLRDAVAAKPASGPSATISIGLATMLAGDDNRAPLTRADAALYAAKLGGRNRVAEAA